MSPELLASISRLLHTLPYFAFLFVFCVMVLPGWLAKIPFSRWGAGARINQGLLPYARRVVYAIAIVWAAAIWAYVLSRYPSLETAWGPLLRLYALTALFLFFLVLVPGLVRVFLPRFPLNPTCIRARRALGLSAFLFALTHAALAFFIQLGGSLAAPSFLSPRHQIAIGLAVVALIIFSALALTSFDRMVARFGPGEWKRLHRLAYPGIILVLVHAFLIGSHFSNPKEVLPTLISSVAMLLLILEASATMVKLLPRRSHYSSRAWYTLWTALILLVLIGCAVGLFALAQSGFDPHATHPRVSFLFRHL